MSPKLSSHSLKVCADLPIGQLSGRGCASLAWSRTSNAGVYGLALGGDDGRQEVGLLATQLPEVIQ